MRLADHARDLIGRTVYVTLNGWQRDEHSEIVVTHVADDGLVGIDVETEAEILVPWDGISSIVEAVAA